MSKILDTPKGKVITLADGNEYTLAPSNLNTLTDLEDAFECDIDEVQAKLAAGRKATVFKKLLWIFLQEGYPELTMRDVGRLVPLDKMTELVAELTEALESLNV